MPLQELTLSRVLSGAIAAACWLAVIAWSAQPHAPAPSLRYDALPMKVAQSMLSLTDVGRGDVVYDLGCGDADIVIIATRRLGARAVCIGTDSRRIAEIQERARQAGVVQRIEFRNEDYRTTSIGNATVVVLRLSVAQNLELRAKLAKELKPGTLVISHEHGMGDWKPVLTAYVRSGGEDRPVHLWTIPAR